MISGASPMQRRAIRRYSYFLGVIRIPKGRFEMAHGKPTRALLEDFILREKITHFDHERIPERIVHARGSGAHGFFELTESLSQYTKADFLQRVGEKTPVPAAEPLLCRVGISAAQPDAGAVPLADARSAAAFIAVAKWMRI